MSQQFDVAERQALVLGHPPRIDPLETEQVPEAVWTAMNKIRAGIGLGPLEALPEFNATMAKAPDLMFGYLALSTFLFQGKLSMRDRELAVLRVGWLCRAPFEWSEHVKIAKRMAGVTDEDVERMKVGSGAEGWNAHEAAVIRAVEELFADAMISDETWAVLARTLDEQQLLELPILVSLYQGTAYLQNSVRVRLMPGSEGLFAR
jgi:alkylhydroperoxidase family enzyme